MGAINDTIRVLGDSHVDNRGNVEEKGRSCGGWEKKRPGIFLESTDYSRSALNVARVIS